MTGGPFGGYMPGGGGVADRMINAQGVTPEQYQTMMENVRTTGSPAGAPTFGHMRPQQFQYSPQTANLQGLTPHLAGLASRFGYMTPPPGMAVPPGMAQPPQGLSPLMQQALPRMMSSGVMPVQGGSPTGGGGSPLAALAYRR